MAANYTENYRLPQWAADDPVLREDFNQAWADVDAGLAAKAEQAALAEYRAGNDAAVAQLNAGLTKAKQELSAAAAAAQAAADAAYSPDQPPFVVGVYQGTGKSGESNPCQITVGFRPAHLLVCPALARQSTNVAGDEVVPPSHLFASYPSVSAAPAGTVTWSDSGVSWYGSSAAMQCNASGNSYFYIVFR